MRVTWQEMGNKAACAAAVLFLQAAILPAEQIKQTIPTTANPSFQLRNQSGDIRVEGWEQNEIEIQGDPSSDAVEVEIAGSEQKVSVQTHPAREDAASPQASVNFQIRVPRQATLRLDSEHGTVRIDNMQGNVMIEGVSNSVEISGSQGHVSVRTVDGPIVIRSSEGHITAHSISGDLKFVKVNGLEVVGSTSSGAISYEGDFGSGGNYLLNNYSSAISILTSARASFDLTARAMEGSIESNISFRPVPLASPFRRLSPRKFLQGRFNSGESTVQVTSYSGTIRLHGPSQAGMR